MIDYHDNPRRYEYFPTGKLVIRKNIFGQIVLQEVHEQCSFVFTNDEKRSEGKFKAVDLTLERLLELKMTGSIVEIDLWTF